MDKEQDYIAGSLELHLFFDRIMKEHSFFLKVGFMPPNSDFVQEAEHLLRQFEAVLARAITLSEHTVCDNVLDSGEIVTEFTDQAEAQTQRFTGTFINRELTARELQMQGRSCNEGLRVSPALSSQVMQLNRDALVMLERLINFKERVLHNVEDCSMFTVNYPLLIEHILREARMYRAHLMRLEGLGDSTGQELRDNELFWDQIMMEHALFIRGLLDPSEDALISSANDFANDYRRLLQASLAANDRMIDSANTLALTKRFRDFKRAGVEGIETCQIRSIILPLLADHVLREANRYLRLLES